MGEGVVNLNIKTAKYIGSYPSEKSCPQTELPEYAFIGRSNVGKSSLINALCGRNQLALTSKRPGKTQTINYFKINEEWFLVDLPGYGYAKISKTQRQVWKRMVEGYLIKRRNLQCAFVLIDGSIPPQKIDLEFLDWLGHSRIPFVIVYTKVDKVKNEELVQENIENIQKALLEYWNELPQQFTTSSNEKRGRGEILQFINDVNQQYYGRP